MSAEHSAEPSDQPRVAKPSGNVECFVGGCGNTAEAKIMFKFPCKGERREAWCRALEIDPKLDVIGRSRLLKGALVCQDHFVMEEDVDNYMYRILMGSKMKLKKSAVPRLTVTAKQNITAPVAVNVTEKEISIKQEETGDRTAVPCPPVTPELNVAVKRENSTEKEETKSIVAVSPSCSRKMTPYVNLVRLSASAIVNALYPTDYRTLSKPRIIGVDATQPKPASFDENTVEDTNMDDKQPNAMPAKVTPPNATPQEVTLTNVAPPKSTPSKVTSPEVTPSKVTSPEVTPSKVTSPEVTPSKVILTSVTLKDVTLPEVTLTNVTPAELTPSKAAPPKVMLLNATMMSNTRSNVAPKEVAPCIVPSKVTPLEITKNEPELSPLKVIQPSALPLEPKFTCHHCSHQFDDLGSLRTHVSAHLERSCSKGRPRKNKFCCVPVCYKSTEGNADTLFFRAPRNLETWLKWSEIFGIVNVDYTRCKHTRFVVCEDHFDEKDIIAKGDTVRLRKNALPKKPFTVQGKSRPKSASGATSEEMKNITVVNGNKSENQKPKRVRKTVKKSLPGAQQSVPVSYCGPEGELSAEPVTGGVPGTPGLKLNYVRRLVKCGPLNERIPSSPKEKKVRVPVAELLKSGYARIVSDAPGESKLILPMSQDQKPGYPTKRVVRIIKLPAGTKVTDQLKLVHTVGSSKVGWTEAINKKIITAADNQPTDGESSQPKTMDGMDVNFDLDDPNKTPQNASGTSQRTASPSITKLVKAGRNMILVRTKPESAPTPESNIDTSSVSADLNEPEKYRPGPKSKRQKKPARPALKVVKGVAEIKFKVEPTDTRVKLEPNSPSTPAKAAVEKPPEVTPSSTSPLKSTSKRGKPNQKRKPKIKNGNFNFSPASTSISRYMEDHTETPSTPKTATAVVAAQNVKTERKYRPGPKCFKRKLEEKSLHPQASTLPFSKTPKSVVKGNLNGESMLDVNVEPKTAVQTKSVLGKRRKTKLAEGVNPQALESSPFAIPHQLIVVNTSYPPNSVSPKTKPAIVNIAPKSNPVVQMKRPKYVTNPKFKKNFAPNKDPTLPGPRLLSATTTAAQACEFTLPQSKSILGKRRRTTSKIAYPPAPESTQPTTVHCIPSPNTESSERVDAEPTLGTTNAPFVPKFERPTTRHSTGKLRKPRIFDGFETDASARTSPTKSTRSPNRSPLKNIILPNPSTLGAKIGHLAVPTLANFLTPSPPAKRIKLTKHPSPSSLVKNYPWAGIENNFHSSPRILVLSKISRDEIRQSRTTGEFTCGLCGEDFHTDPQLRLHVIVSAPSCTVQKGSLDHSKREEILQMPTTDNAIKTCFDLVKRIGVGTTSSVICDDIFEDQFPDVKQEDKKPAYIRDWNQHPVDPPLIRFSGLTPGFKPAEFGSSPFDYFLHFVTPEFLQETCAATNRNIERVRSEMKPEDCPMALLTVGELMSFLGVVLLHFTVLGGVAEWLGDYGLPVNTCMDQHRFKFLLQALSVSEQTDDKPSPLLRYFNERMRQISNPPKQLLLSDSAIVQNDSLVYSRFFDNSACQGILYNLSGQDGTVHRICLKKDAVHPPGRNDFPNPVIASLMDGLFHKGYSLYMNSFYCSVQLAEDLLKWKTYCTGTVRNSRIVAPPEIHWAMPEQLLVMGRSTLTATSYYTDAGICFTKWDEGREIMCVSSEWGPTMVGNDDFVRPKMYHNYVEMTKTEGAPPVPRLALPRGDPDVHLTLQILAVLIRNAYILYSNDVRTVSSSPPITFEDFRFQVAKHLLVYPTPVTISPHLRSHLPTLIEAVRHSSVLMPRKMCDECEERATVTFCAGCPGAPSLCLDCYRTCHEQISILIFKNPQKT